MARLGRLGFLGIAVVFHLIYARSIFDIYFVSPIVSGMREFRVDAHEPPAKRLVLFVGDGLRADKAFQSFPDPSPPPSEAGTRAALQPRPLAPFLRSRVLHHGTFGVSHTRVPTESRPGHVALIAGLYEDVSAVMTGWKLNPVNFDSVFNRSAHTWSWGSPDILPMFKEGAVPGRVDADMYGSEAEDYTQDATSLDTWVFDRVRDMFRDARAGKDVALDRALRQEGNVFFLHLLGLDSTGHAYRPYSKEYLHNIKVVDSGVKEMTELIEDFYGDGKTAFVFTADHGMSDWGSHGDGHPDNTRTPLIAWGSGVAKPVLNATGTAAGHEDGFSSDWGLDHVQRNDVWQADVAALMSYLAGLAFPVNSVGELPLAYLKGNLRSKAEALLVNARQILEMYRVKEMQKQSTALRFKPFASLDGSSGGEDGAQNSTQRVARIQASLQRATTDADVRAAIAQTEALIQLALQGLRYLQTYDWLFLRALVTAGYLGWMAFAVTTVVDLHVLHGRTETARTPASTLAFSAVLVALYAALVAQRSSWTYYAYAAFPVMFWEEVYARRSALVHGKEVLLGHLTGTREKATAALSVAASIALLEALVQSYFHREVYTVCYILAIGWPAFYGQEFWNRNRALVSTWAICCVLMSIFTLLPVVKVEDINLILLGGFLMFAAGVLYLLFEKSIVAQSNATITDQAPPGSDTLSRMILGLQIGLIPLAMLVTKSSTTSLQAKEGLPLGTQIVGWVVILASLTVPFLHGLQPQNHYIHRLAVICLAFAPMFIILTISYEGLFYFTFCATLITWVRLEHHIYRFNTSNALAANDADVSPVQELNPLKPALASARDRLASLRHGSYRSLSLADARISLFFFFLLQSAFFSTGNIASISSFSLDAVYRLIPVFDPFSQGALLILKILAPFALISANLGILNRRLGVAPSALFMVVMAVSDVLTLNFFYMVRDEGSWLDIGTTISHFCIASGLCVFVALLEAVSEMFVSGVEIEGLDARAEGNDVVADKAGNGTVAVGSGVTGNGKRARDANGIEKPAEDSGGATS